MIPTSSIVSRWTRSMVRCKPNKLIALLVFFLIVVMIIYYNHHGETIPPGYKDICYLTVKDDKECRAICNLDSLCYYTIFYPSANGHNCFTQLFFNDSETDCSPYNASNIIFHQKDDMKYVNSYQEASILDTPTCRRPNYHPFHSSIKTISNRLGLTKKFPCNKRMSRRFKIEDDSISLLRNPSTGEECKLRYIYRPKKYVDNDDHVSYTDWHPLTTEPVELVDEFVEVVCSRHGSETYRDYSSYVPKLLAKKRINEAKEIKNSKSSRRFPEKMNVLMFGLDSTSLSQGYRLLPRTLGYLRQHHDVITFNGYNRVQDNTFMNLYTVLTGRRISEGVGISFDRFFDEDPLIFKWFNNDSFVTGYYEDYKTGALFNWLKKGFHYSPASHYFRPFSVEVESKVATRWWTDFCYLDKGMHVWEGDWTSSFVKQYAKLNYPYFLWSWTTMIAHESANTLGMGDEYYYLLFKDLDKVKALNNTILVLYSDHGYRYGGLRATKVGQHEENSPMMHWIIPAWFQKKYAKEMEILRTNAAKRLTSPFDLHRTLLDFADGALSSATAAGMESFGRSFFDPIDERRTCADAGVTDHFCGCRTSEEYPIDDPFSKRAAQAVVDAVNKITEVNRNLCLVYSLRYIKAAYINHRYDIKEKHLRELVVTVGVKPSDAEFSATVHLHDTKAEVKGISRVSLYGSSANCVGDFEMRLYCSCKSLTRLN